MRRLRRPGLVAALTAAAGGGPDPRRPAARTAAERVGAAGFLFSGDDPVPVTGARWAVVVGAVAAGYLALVSLEGAFHGPFTGFVPPLLFAGLPFAAFRWAAGRRWRAVVGPVTGAEIASMAGFAALTAAVTALLGGLVAVTTGVSANPEAGVLAEASPLALAMFYPQSLIQLFGEELLAILPFLALLRLFTGRARLDRRRAVLASWILTSVVFGLLHLPTYHGNVVQCVLVIGGARMALTFAYLRTRNLWVSTGAHVLFDWFLLTMPLVLTALSG